MSSREETEFRALSARDKHRVLLHEALTRVSLFNLCETSKGWKDSVILKIVKDNIAVYPSKFRMRIRTRRA